MSYIELAAQELADFLGPRLNGLFDSVTIGRTVPVLIVFVSPRLEDTSAIPKEYEGYPVLIRRP